MRSKALVLLSVVGICHLIGGAWSLRPDDRPGLTELQLFSTYDGNSLNLLQEIGAKYEDIGICLLDDETGAKMGAIQSDNQNLESKMRDVFRKWLQGGGKRPETWATVVICLRQVSLNYIADIIEAKYRDSGSSPPTPETDTVTRKSTTPQRQPAAESKGDLDDEVKNLSDLIQAVKEIGNWRGLCINLGVSEGKIDALLHSTDTVEAKKSDCLQAYFNEREAKWSDVIRAVSMHPISNRRIAKKIAKEHGLDFKDEL